ncbi:MAG: hypothetical protein WC626_03110 [Methanoregula sp.]
MADIIIPDYIFGLLFFAICLSTMLYIGRAMNDCPKNKPVKTESKESLYLQFLCKYDKMEIVAFVLGLVMIGAIILFFWGILQINSVVQNLPQGDARNSISGFMLSSIGLGLSMLAMSINFVIMVSNGATSRKRHNEIIALLTERSKK